MKPLSILLIILSFSIQNAIAQSNEYIQEMVDAVSQDSIVSYIGALQSFGTRYEYTPEQESSATYILNSMLNANAQAESDWYSFGTVTFYDLDIIDENRVCAVGQSGAVAYSTNGGSSWSAGNVPLSTGNLLGVDFVNSQKGWAVGSSGKIIATTDGGGTWTEENSGIINTLYDVAFIDDTAGIAIGTQGKILKTSDGGLTWGLINSGLTEIFYELCIIDGSHIWAVGNSHTILFSTNRGLTWSPQAYPDTLDLMAVDFSDINHGWAVGFDGTILKTTDRGLLWSPVPPPAEMRSYFRGVSFVNDTVGILLDRYGILFKTTDGGESWLKVSTTLNLGWGPILNRVKKYGDRHFMTIGSVGCVFASSDTGNTWVQLRQNLPSDFLHLSRNIVATIPGSVTPEKEFIMVAHYDSYSTENITVTAPGANDNASGTSVVMEAARLMKNYEFESTIKLIAVSAEEFGMYGSSDYAIRAHNQGKNIIGVVNGDMIGYPVTADTARLVIGSYLTRNRLIDSALVYNQRYDIGLTLSPFIDNTGASDYGPFAALGYDALDVAEASANEIWGGADPFYHTPGDSLDKLCPSLIHKGAQLMAATIAELAKPIGRITGVKDAKLDIPKEFCLGQNFPNPFNPTTNIRFTIKEVGWTKLTVFDILGREAAILCNEERGPGSYQVTWNASAMSNGVYFCQLKSGSNVETKKMILVK
jgi:photosystem II stability/assembly factor-like uncharacterized protein